MCSDGAIVHHQHGTTPAPEVRKRTFHGLPATVAHPWFVAADVCAALGVANVTDALSRLDDDETTLVSIEGGSGCIRCGSPQSEGLHSTQTLRRRQATRVATGGGSLDLHYPAVGQLTARRRTAGHFRRDDAGISAAWPMGSRGAMAWGVASPPHPMAWGAASAPHPGARLA